ncbi:GntR family transcriptional regulator [Rhizobium brockwellii]|uniref:GntR family transcriptional regulator n=1 Tax=Rhizobium brockwellii TaxID=3019932 RepID=A0ABU3YM69_9HYPH|nr:MULTISPECIES: GntR family transcriptional regulator [Rhizobium]KPN26599.1 GntR family transcriptional regulator [Rhizobium brockwellii]MDV4153056.1 GntR family transcriptional regulator [Rhizobium brockwellii]MDV4180019.1 GntR family transcriptional regulator [Rhizobium brockwellii]MDV4186941.1 GntR family transcriptional regulator [Rhizobium brockwellii]QIO53131.1 GntR family transcriptional regulator [Rhizobium leguminosarum bv. trifolii]
MRTDTTFKRAFNDMIDIIRTLDLGAELPSENALRAQLGVSRTTVRKVLAGMSARGIIISEAHRRIIREQPRQKERYPKKETLAISEQVETSFMEWMLRGDACPGTEINEAELARKFGVATTIVREFLNRFQKYGLIEKRQNAGWVFKGFTASFALELFEIREMFEMRSARLFSALPDGSPVWKQIQSMRAAHLELLADIDARFQDFSELDSRFHRLITAVAPNRFIESFQDVITMVFHYHYQWNKRDERARNEVAIKEHLALIEALESRNIALIDRACRLHLTSARETLLRSIA